MSVATPRVVAPPTTPQRGPAHAAWPRPSAWGRPLRPRLPRPATWRPWCSGTAGRSETIGAAGGSGPFPAGWSPAAAKLGHFVEPQREWSPGGGRGRLPAPPCAGKLPAAAGAAPGRFCRGPPVNSSCFGGVTACHCCSLLLCHRRQLIKERARPDPIKLLWTLKSEAHVIFTCHEIFVLVKCKTILSSLAVNKLKQAVFLTQCPLSGSSICCRHVD